VLCVAVFEQVAYFGNGVFVVAIAWFVVIACVGATVAAVACSFGIVRKLDRVSVKFVVEMRVVNNVAGLLLVQRRSAVAEIEGVVMLQLKLVIEIDSVSLQDGVAS
jgi:hypothetical protein